MDTNADYMGIICDYVVKSNNDIYEEIRNEYEKFKKTPEFVGDGLDAGMWTYDYHKKMDVVQKNKLFAKYGLVNMLKSQAQIADILCFNTVNQFLNECEDLEGNMIIHIISSEVLV